jgi:AraC-like DNA-binding protein
MALVNSREIHALQKNSEECLCMIVQVSEVMFSFEEMEDKDSELHFFLNSTDEEAPACGFELLDYRMAKIVYESIRDSHISKFRIRAQADSLIADLMEFSVYDKRIKNKDAGDQQNTLIALIEYLESNLMNEGILDKACTEFGISRKTMDRMVGGILNISAKDLLDSLRIEKAKRLLRYSAKSISYIMDVCGYVSENTFYRSFKKYMGSTPKDYRKSIEPENEQDELKGYLDYETPRVMVLLKEIIEEWENRNYR